MDKFQMLLKLTLQNAEIAVVVMIGTVEETILVACVGLDLELRVCPRGTFSFKRYARAGRLDPSHPLGDPQSWFLGPQTESVHRAQCPSHSG